MKFTDAGRVEVALEPDDGRARVHVSDTGPGVEPGDRDRIFEPFTQADSSATRQKGGTGLGLAVSRRLATLLGGTLTLESTPREGARFTLTLPG